MSKIAEQKALEAYPVCDDMDEFNRIYERKVYIQAYDQAMQDFMEKAERWLEIHMPFGKVSHESVYDCIQGFKNYMQDEM